MSQQTEQSVEKPQPSLGFLREIFAEAKRVQWPSWEETKNASFTVVGMVTVLGLFLGGVDMVASTLLDLLKGAGFY